MKTSTTKSLFLVCLGLFVCLRGFAGGGGGVGPTVFAEVYLKPSAVALPAPKDLEEFLYLPKSQRILMRDHSRSLWLTDINGSYLQLLGAVPGSVDEHLSQVVSPDEKLVLSGNGASYFDLGERKWKTFLDTANPMHHLFWNGNDLYTYAEVPIPNDEDHIQIQLYDYNRQTGVAKKLCAPLDYRWYSQSDNPENGEDTPMSFMEGSTFPVTHLYYSENEPSNGYTSWRNDIDVTNCDKESYFYLNGFELPGVLGQGYWVPKVGKEGETSFELNGPDWDLRFIVPGLDGALHYQVTKPFIYAAPGLPLVVSIDPKNGLQVADLEKSVRTNLNVPFALNGIADKHTVRVTPDRRWVLVAPQGAQGRTLYRLDLNPPKITADCRPLF